MRRLVTILFLLTEFSLAKCWTKEPQAHWVSDHPGATDVFDEKTGTKIGVLTKGRLVKTMENFQEIHWSIRNAEGKKLESGITRIEHYEYTDDSHVQKVRQGKTTKYTWNQSKIFPGTRRDYLVYVPAQYDPSKPAALLVSQDGLRHADPDGPLRATTVLDNLIAKGEIPVTIGVFINPGRFAHQEPQEKPKNRSLEYDSLGDTYARFLHEEILPEVEKKYRLTQNPHLRCIMGGSSGGICSWTVCWERPDSFGRALIWVGTFVDIKGGHHYPAMIRKSAKKPIRAYLLDGENDLDNRFGNWPLANRQMAAALKFKDYDFHFDYGKCFHGSKAAGAKLPEMLRWIWRDWKHENPGK